MEEDLKKVCQLLVLDKESNKLALTLIKNQPALRAMVEQCFQPILAILKKKTLRSLPSIAQNVCKGTYSSTQFQALFQEAASMHLFPTSITHVCISNRKLTVLPNWIGELNHLTFLDLSKNELTEVPASIGQLSKLTRLDLGCNKLRKLPNSIGLLSSLEVFTVWENYLDTLPESLINLPHLRVVYAQFNLMGMTIPPCLLEQNNFILKANPY